MVLYRGVFFVVVGALFVVFAGWWGREMAENLDYNLDGRPTTAQERERDERHAATGARLVGAGALAYGMWNLWRGTLQ